MAFVLLLLSQQQPGPRFPPSPGTFAGGLSEPPGLMRNHMALLIGAVQIKPQLRQPSRRLAKANAVVSSQLGTLLPGADAPCSEARASVVMCHGPGDGPSASREEEGPWPCRLRGGEPRS